MHKETIVIVHGWTTNTSGWDEVAKQLSIDFSVKVLKVPGLSDQSDKVWNLEDYTNWLSKELQKIKGSICLVGHSNGGRIALNLLSKDQRLVGKLVLVDAAGLPRKELKLRIKRSVFKVVAKTGKKLSKNETARKVLYKLARERDYLEANPNQRQTMANLLAADSKFNVKQQIPINTLLIWGDQDKATPLKDAHILNSILKPSQLKIIKDAGHSPHRTNPQEVSRLISNFLKGEE